jgi:hypothetical protein
MTDKSKTDAPQAEELTTEELDDVQGGLGNFEIQDFRKTGDRPSKGIVLSSETEEPNLKQERDKNGYLIITMEN